MRLLLFIPLFLALTACSELTFISGATTTIKQATNPYAGHQRDFKGIATVDRNEYYKIGSPYKIKGIWYYPKADYHYIEEGIASWYGPNFHGKMTANGGTFNQNALTAAHRTLPMPSIVRVTNLENGRALVVKINDRGPFAHNRIIDLSKAAAEALDMVIQGTALVRVEILPAESIELAELVKGEKMVEDRKLAGIAPKPLAAPSRSVTTTTLFDNSPAPTITQKPVQPAKKATWQTPDIFIQVGAFGQYQNALKVKAKISQRIRPILIEQFNRSETPLFRVRIGPIDKTEEADKMLAVIHQLGFTDAHIIVP